MTPYKVYLAGPITGLTYDEAEDWRQIAREDLAPEIACYSPLRDKSGVLRDKGILAGSYEMTVLARARSIITRDHWDCMTADLVLVNLVGAKSASIGTCMEIAWAYAYRKPLVVVVEPTGNIHEHPMIVEAIGFRVETMSEAVAVVRAILLP